MQFLVTAYDGRDSEAAARREAAREAHRKLGYEMIRDGSILFSTGILNDNEEPCGSVRVMQFESREDLDAWLAKEPYVTGNVWQDIDVKRCKMGPAFEWVTLEPTLRLTPNDDD